MTAADIAEQVGIPIVRRCGLALVHAGDACRLIAALESSALGIVGLEAFHELDEGIAPDMDHILDLSDLPAHRSLAEARAFLLASRLPDDRLIDFQLSDAGGGGRKGAHSIA